MEKKLKNDPRARAKNERLMHAAREMAQMHEDDGNIKQAALWDRIAKVYEDRIRE